MLVKICDVCGERIDTNNYVYMQGGFLRNKDKYNDNQKRDFIEFDICVSCAKSYNLMQVVESVRISNV